MLSHILANWSDPFVLNGLIEAGAGLVSLLIPTLMFSTAKGNPVATYLARWWAAAVIGIGFACLLISTGTCLSAYQKILEAFSDPFIRFYSILLLQCLQAILLVNMRVPVFYATMSY